MNSARTQRQRCATSARCSHPTSATESRLCHSSSTKSPSWPKRPTRSPSAASPHCRQNATASTARSPSCAAAASHTLPADRASERAREVIRLADEPAGDSGACGTTSTGEPQPAPEPGRERRQPWRGTGANLFSGIDVIGQRCRPNFRRVLAAADRPAAVVGVVRRPEAVIERLFARQLTTHERRFPLGLYGNPDERRRGRPRCAAAFRTQLEGLVQSREFREQRRLHALLKEATQARLCRSRRPCGRTRSCRSP